MRISSPLWLFAILALATSCKGPPSAKATATEALPGSPAEEATPAQRKQIDETLTQIEGFAAELGRPQRFRSVPVVVSSGGGLDAGKMAACVAVRGAPQFIVLKPKVLEVEAILGPQKVESTLFRVLLHEIGHCYFRREHEEASLRAKGRRIALTFRQEDRDVEVGLASVDATVMTPGGLLVPVALEKYYVAEMLGLARARRLEDLAPFVKMRLVEEPKALEPENRSKDR